MYVVPDSEAFRISVLPITSIISMFPDSVPSNPAAIYRLQQTIFFFLTSLVQPGQKMNSAHSSSLFLLLTRHFGQQKLQSGETIPDVISTKRKGSFPLTISLIHVKNIVLEPKTDKIESVLISCFTIHVYIHTSHHVKIHRIFKNNPGREVCHYFHFTDKTTNSEKVNMNTLQRPK